MPRRRRSGNSADPARVGHAAGPTVLAIPKAGDLWHTSAPDHRLKSFRIFRGVEDPNEVVIQIECASTDEAKMARERLIAAKVLDRFRDKTVPTVVEEANTLV